MSRPSKKELAKHKKEKVPFVNPYFDELYFFWKTEVQSLQDKFKPYHCKQCDVAQLYIGYDKQNKTDFVNKIQAAFAGYNNPDWMFKEKLLVQFSVSDIKKRIDKIDIDNLSKTILDCMKGIVFEDDKQVVALAGHKHVKGDFQSMFIAIRRLGLNEIPQFQNKFSSIVEQTDYVNLKKYIDIANSNDRVSKFVKFIME